MTSLEHCQYYVERKKRYCRMTVKKDKKYCGEHESYYESYKINDERIVCPLDSKHTCYKSKLSKHLKVCNAKIKQDKQPPYIVKGINLGCTIKECFKDKPLSEIEQKTIDIVLNKIKNSYDKLPEIPNEILQHKILDDELCNPTYGTEAKRHLLQTSSLLGHLAQADLIHKNTCFIEFGAGRGKLTYWLAQAIKNQANSSILLIDRSSHRHKRDNKLKNEQFGIEIIRIRADIADLKLNDVPEVTKMPCRVAIAKHICGTATDLTLRCITNSMKNNETSKVGIIIAFCCHHSCEYSHYVGHKYLEDEGFTKEEFQILCKIASWATCGIKLNNANDDCEREIMGRKVKTLLNWGRLEYLKSLGFDCQLVYYTSIDTTLENMCIIATFSKKNLIIKP